MSPRRTVAVPVPVSLSVPLSISLLVSLSLAVSACTKAKEKSRPAPAGDSAATEPSAARMAPPPDESAQDRETPGDTPEDTLQDPSEIAHIPDEPVDKTVLNALEDMLSKRHLATVDVVEIVILPIASKSTKPAPDPRPEAAPGSPGQPERAFIIYGYSSFDEWQGKKRKSGELSKFNAELEADQRKCRADHARDIADAEKKLERLRASTDDPDDEAVEAAEMKVDDLSMYEPDCPGWSQYYPDADRSGTCGNDIMGVARYDIVPASKPQAPPSFKLIREDSVKKMCGIDSPIGDAFTRVEDIDKDGAVEVILAWRHTDMYDDTGRGDVDTMTTATEVRVYRDDMTLQGQWSADISVFPEPEPGELEPSGRLRSWFADKNGDGRRDFIYREIRFDPGCDCADAKFVATEEPEAWLDQVQNQWHLTQKECNDVEAASTDDADDKSKRCRVKSDKTHVMLYDAKSDTWKK